MSNQTSNLDSQLIESNLLESDLDSDLLPGDEASVSINSQAEESEALELDIETTASITNLNLFNDSEIATSSLYSNSMAFNHTGDESFEEDPETPTEETEILPEDTEIPTEESEVALTKTIVVGDEGGTQFTFNIAEDTPQEVVEGITQAAENWSSVLTDDVNVSIDFTFAPDEAGRLGGAIPTYIPLPYADETVGFDVNRALTEDVTSINDDIAVNNLPTDNNINLLINNTAENNGSDTPYLDNNGGLNNSTIVLTSANAEALGLSLEDIAESLETTPEAVAEFLSQTYDFPIDANAVDGTININSDVVWDFDSSDGISTDAVDFVGTMTHEIGHTLGFASVADFLDGEAVAEFEEGELAGINMDRFVSENEYPPFVLDLFRFSPESFEQGSIDITTGNIDDKYFSVDGGQTEIAPLSEGANTATNLGDRQQLSHWEDNLGIGIMDPTFAPGELGEISDTDLLAFDVIGWDLA